jgi:flagellar basal body rod protein FlgF
MRQHCFRLPLRLVHGVQASALANISRPGTSARLVETLKSAGRQYLTEARAMVQEAHPGLNVGVDLQRADPLPMSIDLSETARLVVVGSRGSAGLAGSW